jgi:ribosomal peptide maturation radical SAM protein 1
MKKVLLLSMPYGALERQALGLSIFKSQLTNLGYACDIKYLTFTFARLIGVENYYWVTNELPHTAFAGEWTFTRSLYDDDNFYRDNYVNEILKEYWYIDDISVSRLLNIRKLTDYFLDYCFSSVNWGDYAIVGFTSTFEQNICSLALARRLKKAYPDIIIVFGGANWEGEMGIELHRCFPFVDYAFSGEADFSFPLFVKLCLGGALNSRNYRSIPGLIYRHNGKSFLSRAGTVVGNLDMLPIPDYSDYFNDLDKSSTSSFVVPSLLFESSRGCWWGNKHHCRFCGLNGSLLYFRSKNATRVLDEIEHLSELYKIDMLQAVDNVLNMSYFDDLLPSLANSKKRFTFFYEVRANLSRIQVKKLRDAGILHVQPGIESLNNHVLHLLNKGTKALQNIQLLKWCKEYGVRTDWNLLYGIPGETEADYMETLSLLEKIRYLDAPTGCGPIRLDRFSPYFDDPEAYGLINIRPIAPYKYLYRFNSDAIKRIANYFEYDYASPDGLSKLNVELRRYVKEWQSNPEHGIIEFIEIPGGKIQIIDTRSSARLKTVVLGGIDKYIYLYCDQTRSLDSICSFVNINYPDSGIKKDQIKAFLSTQLDFGYMVSDGLNYLSLALFNNFVKQNDRIEKMEYSNNY